MSGNLWTYLGALLIMGGLCMVYSWKLEADRAAELERKVELLEERVHADDAVMAQRDKARKEAEQKAREQRDEIQKAFEGLDDDELLRRLHGLCSKSADKGSTDAASGKPASGMPATSKTGGHD